MTRRFICTVHGVVEPQYVYEAENGGYGHYDGTSHGCWKHVNVVTEEETVARYIKPDVLPRLEVGIDKFIKWRDRPCPLLPGKMCPIDMLKCCMEVEPDRTWFVGSSAWMPLVQGRMFDNESDIDIVVSSREAHDAFVEKLVEAFSQQDKTIAVETFKNTHEGTKFKRTSNTRARADFLDVWWLPRDKEGNIRSIQEHVMGFKQAHEHVAIMAGVRPQEIGAVTRIVIPETWEENERVQRDRKRVEKADPLEADDLFYGS